MKSLSKGLMSEFLKIPNLLSLFRLALSIVIPVLWFVKASNKIIFSLIFFGALSDTLDGNLARILKQKSELGKILDPLADKCFINMLFFLFFLEGKIEPSFFGIILARDIGILLGVGYLFKRGIQVKNLNPSLLGKISTVFQLLCLLTLFISNYIKPLPQGIIKSVITLTLFFTVASGFHYFLMFRKVNALNKGALRS
ncbi:MAG: CDP-alcohol phosphatidyltransferase family protein [Caldimicrobium sp.]